jgi:S1-C subfamily serine protease
MRTILLLLAVMPLAVMMISCPSPLQTSLLFRHAIVMTPDGFGSGVYIGNGYFITARHVVLLGDSISPSIGILSPVGETESVKVIWTEGDLALLSTNITHELPQIKLSAPDITEDVYLIQPFFQSDGRFSLFVVRGIVSRINRETFNIDHPVVLGVSGSGVYNKNGQLLGIVRAEIAFVMEEQRESFGEVLMFSGRAKQMIEAVSYVPPKNERGLQ